LVFYVHGESDCAVQHCKQGNYFMRGSIYHTKPTQEAQTTKLATLPPLQELLKTLLRGGCHPTLRFYIPMSSRPTTLVQLFGDGTPSLLYPGRCPALLRDNHNRYNSTGCATLQTKYFEVVSFMCWEGVELSRSCRHGWLILFQK
jgi:hypothetical protein